MRTLRVVLLFFFFSSRRRHTRSYGDWSSDVCSSDLVWIGAAPGVALSAAAGPFLRSGVDVLKSAGRVTDGRDIAIVPRSEERRVGKECSARGARCRENKKKEIETERV